ncbi:hypothetical protein [Rhodopirellula halodulae]|uniref:hypothetical protein n=1 Tax=Rhodopirellula halodulae TaxID=2894198 RepID=UPI001E596DE8|nr:hypothetical protein [Rhodopirellula sp. JC737]MCC9655518.1 hypothetical protein [Rhodopirellula sp. JC737]
MADPAVHCISLATRPVFQSSDTQFESPSVTATAPNSLSRRQRFLVSVLIIGMLLAIVLPPLAFQARGARGLSPSVGTLLSWVSPISQMFYLDRGYAFFAPDPGPSHLIRATSQGGESVQQFPNLEDQWPRLLYHRHFMLAEFLNDSYQPALPMEVSQLIGPELSPEELATLRLGRKRYEKIAGSMVKHLQSQGKTDVSIQRVEHQLPDFVLFVNEGLSLTDERAYIELPDVPISIEDLLGVGPEALPQPDGPDLTPIDPENSEPVPAPTGDRKTEQPEVAPEEDAS